MILALSTNSGGCQGLDFGTCQMHTHVDSMSMILVLSCTFLNIEKYASLSLVCNQLVLGFSFISSSHTILYTETLTYMYLLSCLGSRNLRPLSIIILQMPLVETFHHSVSSFLNWFFLNQKYAWHKGSLQLRINNIWSCHNNLHSRVLSSKEQRPD